MHTKAQQLNDIDFIRNAIAMAVENDTKFGNFEQPEVFR
jgi:hypothetical protein